MSLIKSVAKKAVQANTKELIASGHNPKQAYARAKGVQRKALRKPSAN